MEHKLTNLKIDKAKGAEKPYQLRDGGGLYLEVFPTGSKLWRWKYRYYGQERRMALGAYPEITLAEVRDKHREARKLLTSGTDPMAQRKEEKIAKKIALANSFHGLTLQWFEWWKEGKTSETIENVWARIEAKVLPILGDMPLSEIEAPIILEMVKGIEARGAGTVARKCLGHCSQIFSWAVANHLTKRNPAKDIEAELVLKPHTSKNHPFVEAKDLPQLLQDVDAYGGSRLTVLGLKIMAHTFLRTAEIVRARWEEVDLEQRLWVIPKERMKTIKNKAGEDVTTSHIIPLSTQVVALLKELHTLTGTGEYLFPGQGKEPYMNRATMRNALYMMGYKGEMSGHGFRGMASTTLNDFDFKEDHIEVQLSHVERNNVRRSYNKAKYLAQRAEMLQWWSDYLEKASKGVVLTNVLEFRKTA